MRLDWLGWRVMASSMLVAGFASAAFAEGTTGNPNNGLSSKAFRRNALTTNKEALEKLRRYPLNDELFRRDDGYIARQLRDPKAMAMMEELVECALDQETTVTARDREGNQIGQWRGDMGLCQRWHKDGLNKSEECQEIVTACVMARVNALGKSIPLSLRSKPDILPLRDQVATEMHFREGPPAEDPSEGWLIPSFSTQCPGLDCNWSPARVGTCAPGEEIQLAIDAPSDCEAMGLRVCAGIHGCLGPTGHELPNGSPLPLYSRHLGDKSGACRTSPLTFTCPSDEATAGFYSVMTWPQPPPEPQRAMPRNIVVKIKGRGAYPAPEKDVFKFPEGAFYGNMFKPEMLTLSCSLDNAIDKNMLCTTADHGACKVDLESGDPVGPCSANLVSIPYRNVYACYAYAQLVDDDSSVAALNKRLCGSPDANTECFAYRPQRCHYKGSRRRDSLCGAMGDDGVYGQCRSQVDQTARFRNVITTYLQAPCDFVGEGSLCDAMRAPAPGDDPKVRRRGGCAGCSTDGAGGGLLTSLATALAVLLRPRRRRYVAGSAATSSLGVRAAIL